MTKTVFSAASAKPTKKIPVTQSTPGKRQRISPPRRRAGLTQPEKVTQTRVVSTQRVQLARETLHAANGYFSLSITFGGRVYSRQRSPSAFAAVGTFMTRRRSRFVTGLKW